MAFDEGLAQRIRELLEDDPRVSEKKMFGGVAFFAKGAMAAGIIGDELMVRVGPDMHAEAVARPHARPMDFTGRPMRGFVQVRPAGFEEDADLRAWLERGLAYAAAQQKKPIVKRAQGSAKKKAASKAKSKAKPRARAKPSPSRRRPSS